MFDNTYTRFLHRGVLNSIVLLFTVMVYSQQPGQLPLLRPTYTHHFDTWNSSDCFEDIVIDNTGRLWLISCKKSRTLNSAALQYYDGYELHHYELRDDEGIVTGNVRLEGITKKGLLYGMIDKKIFLSDFDHDTTKLYALPPLENGFNQITRVTESSQGSLFLLLKSTHIDSLQLWSLREGTYSLHTEVPDPVPFIYRYGLPLISTPHDIWFMADKGPMYRTKINDHGVHIYEQYIFDTIIPSNLRQQRLQKLPKLVAQRNGDLFLHLQAGQDSFFLYFSKNKRQWTKIQYDIPADWEPENIFRDQKGNICLLYRNNQGDNTALLRDTSGQLWNFTFMVQGKGEIRGMTGSDFFQKTFLVGNKGMYSMEIDPVDGIDTILSNNWVASMVEIPGDKILINTIDDGWKQYDPLSGRTRDYEGPEGSKNLSVFGRGMKQQIIKDKDGCMWFLSESCLIRYDPDSSQTKRFHLDKNYGLFVFLDHDLVALARQDHHLEFYNLRKQKFENLLPGFSGTFEGRIRDLCYTDHRYLWIPTNRGLYKMDFQKKTIESRGLDRTFGDVRFTSIWEAPDGKLWLGTFYNGVVIYDKDSEERTFVNTSHGLSDNAVMGMIGDLDGDVWVGTENGISFLSPKGDVLGEIHAQDGLSVDAFERFDPFRDSNGLLFFGSSRGVNIIDPGRVKQKFNKSGSVKIYLTDITYYNSSEKISTSKTSGFSDLNQLEIPAGRRNIEIQYALSENINTAKNHFAYKLGSQDTDWTYIGNKGSLDFDYLPAGEYNLLIRGSNHKHQWSENTITIHLYVHDYFYNRFWFYLIILGFLSLIAFIWIRYLQYQRQHLRSVVEQRTRQISRDKDTIERQAQDLKKLDELKTSFFSNISHELKTPITLIKTPVEHILNAYSGQMKDKVSQSLLTVRNNADRLLSLINGYLELSKLELGEPEVIRTEVDIETLIQNVVRSFQMVARVKGVQLVYTLSDDIQSLILLDKERLIIILNNLLNNALKYTGRTGQIEISVDVMQNGNPHMAGECQGNAKPLDLIIKISDTGQGIPQESIPRIFNRFYRVPDHSNSQAGSGIGLALVKELTELMGGEVKVDSQLGHGSTFTVILPTVFAPGKPDRELPSLLYDEPETNHHIPVNEPDGNNSGKILLVEDDPEAQDMIRSILGDTYQLIVTSQGKEALEWLQEHEENGISLIIADLMMPVMDGMSLLKEVKKNEKWKKLPFLMLTAKTAHNSKLKALRLGVDDYLPKPFSPVELQIRAHNLTEKFQKRILLEKEADRFKGIKFEGTHNADETWLSGVEEIIKKALKDNTECSVAFLAKKMNLSERQMNRRLKSLTGMSVGHYIREVKLYKARHLLESKAYDTIAETAYACGFNTPKYFSRLFYDRFGRRPDEYLK